MKRRAAPRVSSLTGALRRPGAARRAGRAARRTQVRVYDERGVARTLDVAEEPGAEILALALALLDARAVR